jgi:hypothetical protein
LHFYFIDNICTFEYNHFIESKVKGHKVASQCVALKQGVQVEAFWSWKNHDSKSCKVIKCEKGLWKKPRNNNIKVGITTRGYDKGITSNTIGNNPIEDRKKLS